MAENAPPLHALPRRRYGRAAFDVCPPGLGGTIADTSRLTDDEAIATVHRAIAMGVEFIDTSAGYGMGERERRLGLALAGGLRRQVDESQPDAIAALRLRRWAEARGVPLPALALQWVLRNPEVSVVIAGAASPAEADENCRAAVHPIPDAVWSALDRDLPKLLDG